jgi:copper transport protein
VELAALRFLESAPAALAVGLLLLPRLLGEAGTRFRWIVAAMALARVATGFWLIQAIAANVMAGQRTLTAKAVADFAMGTIVGKAWIATEILAILFALATALRALWYASPQWLDTVALSLGLGLIASVSLTGHALDESLPFYARISFLLHTAAGLAWLGGLVGLVLWMVAGTSKPPERALLLARRWSLVAQIAIALVVISGLILAWENVGNFVLLLATDYGRLLLLKLTLLCGVLLIALSLWGSLAPYQSRIANPGRFNAVRYSYIAGGEALLGVGLLFIAGWIATLTPALHDETLVWPLTYRVSWAATWGYGVAPWNTNWWEAIAAGLLFPLAAGLWVLPQTRKWRRLLTPAAAGAGLVCAVGALSVQAYPETFRDSTVPFTTDSVARGYDLFRSNCVPCHGALGEGDGPLAKGLPKPPANLTAPHIATHTLGDIFHWLTYGLSGIMPGFDNLSEDDKWDVIDFLVVLSSTYQARPLSPEGVLQWLVAPDVALQNSKGQRTSLIKLRGTPVLISFADCTASDAAAAGLSRAAETAHAAGARHVAVVSGHCPVPEGAFIAAHPEAANLTFALLNRSFDRLFSLHIDEAHFLVDRSGYIRARFQDFASEERMRQLDRDIERYAAEPVVEILKGHGH